MLIASRNQIDSEGGYVGFTSKEFVDYVRKQGGDVIICRDHSGSSSIKNDIEVGFDLIHIDCSNYWNVHGATWWLIKEAGDTLLEVGTEENTGVATSPDKLRSDLEFITGFARPEFVVGGTGSLVKEIYQVGSFALNGTMELVDIAHSFGVKFKEHNADYTTSDDLKLRRRAGVDAVNIGPELGVAQTKAVIGLAVNYGLYNELDAFLRRSLESNRWEKWVYSKPSDFLKSVIAGHYVFNSDEYKRLADKLSQKTDIDGAINQEIFNLIDHYERGMNGDS